MEHVEVATRTDPQVAALDRAARAVIGDDDALERLHLAQQNRIAVTVERIWTAIAVCAHVTTSRRRFR